MPPPLTKSSTSAVSPWLGSVSRLGQGLLDVDEDPVSAIFATADFATWLKADLQAVEPVAGEELDPVEEFEFLLAELLRGRTHCWLQRLMPQKKGIWEVKLQHTRVFGWFPAKRCLIFSKGVGIEIIKAPGPPTYAQMMIAVEAERKSLGTGYIGGDIRNVF